MFASQKVLIESSERIQRVIKGKGLSARVEYKQNAITRNTMKRFPYTGYAISNCQLQLGHGERDSLSHHGLSISA